MKNVIENNEAIKASIRLMTQAVENVRKDIAELEASLSVPVLEDSHALVMDDGKGLRIYGEWKNRGTGFAHIETIPAHICGTFGYGREKAIRQVAKLNEANREEGVDYTYMHFRELRQTILTARKSALASTEKFLAQANRQLAQAEA